MTFQFICPRGHLLQSDPSQAGQRCRCPSCESEFIVPQPSADPRPDHLPIARAEAGDGSPADNGPSRLAEAQPPEAQPPEAQPPEAPSGEVPFPEIRTGATVAGDPSEAAAQIGLGGAHHGDLLHIACPQGHVLDTPRDMLGQDAICPHCQTQFRLRLEDSQEYRREQSERYQRKEQKLAKSWLHWAIATAVVVVLAVVFMIVLAAYR